MDRRDSEIAGYFLDLLDHQAQCAVEGCQACAALSSILELIRERLFTTVVYANEVNLLSTPALPNRDRILPSRDRKEAVS